MTKYVHCTVVETRVSGREPRKSSNPQTAKPKPRPEFENLNNAYLKRFDSFSYEPTTLDLLA